MSLAVMDTVARATQAEGLVIDYDHVLTIKLYPYNLDQLFVLLSLFFQTSFPVKSISCTKFVEDFWGTWKSKPGSLHASNESTSNCQSIALSTSGEESLEWPKNLLHDGWSRIEVDDNMHNMRLCFNYHFIPAGKNAQNYIWQCVMNNKLASRYTDLRNESTDTQNETNLILMMTETKVCNQIWTSSNYSNKMWSFLHQTFIFRHFDLF